MSDTVIALGMGLATVVIAYAWWRVRKMRKEGGGADG